LKKIVQYHLWSILWGILIIILTALPGNLIPEVPSFFDLFEPDKLVHIFIFAVLVALLIRGFILQDGPLFWKTNAVSIALNIGVLLSGLTELMQKFFIPGRIASVYDFIANVAGCFLGWWIFSIWLKKQKISHKN
jgi:VanZ family protein